MIAHQISAEQSRFPPSTIQILTRERKQAEKGMIDYPDVVTKVSRRVRDLTSTDDRWRRG